MKQIAVVIVALVLSHCGKMSPTSPEAVAGRYELQTVKIDVGVGNKALVYVRQEDVENSLTGFIELNADRTYRLFARFGEAELNVWEASGKYGVSSRFEITFSTPGRSFAGSLYDNQSRIAVTEVLSHSVVLLLFERRR